MESNDIKFILGGKQISLDRSRIKALAAMMKPKEGEDPAATFASAMNSTGLVSWGPAVELEPDGPATTEDKAL